MSDDRRAGNGLSSPQEHDWAWYRKAMHHACSHHSRQWTELLSCIEALDIAMGVLVDRVHGPHSDRPQDFVACSLTHQAWRVGISAVHLSASGYPDVAVALERSLWEAKLRLCAMVADPVPVALGYLLHAAEKELDLTSTLQERATECGTATTDHEHARRWHESHRDALKDTARRLGHDPDFLRRRHRDMKLDQLAGQLDMRSEYYTTYRSGCLSTHLQWTLSLEATATAEHRGYELGPVLGDNMLVAVDVLRALVDILDAAGKVVGDTAVQRVAARLRVNVSVFKCRQCDRTTCENRVAARETPPTRTTLGPSPRAHKDLGAYR